MFIRSLIQSSRATKQTFVQPVKPLLARSVSTPTDPRSRTPTAKVKVVEGEFSLFKSPSDPKKPPAQDLKEGTYEKEPDTSPEPITTYSGTRSYVVNEPDPADSKYEVPTGAYHSAGSYVGSKEVKHEGYGGERGVKERSSSSSELAHPVTTKRVPTHGAGVGGGGSGAMDKEGTKEGVDWVLESGPPAGKA